MEDFMKEFDSIGFNKNLRVIEYRNELKVSSTNLAKLYFDSQNECRGPNIAFWFSKDARDRCQASQMKFAEAAINFGLGINTEVKDNKS